MIDTILITFHTDLKSSNFYGMKSLDHLIQKYNTHTPFNLYCLPKTNMI